MQLQGAAPTAAGMTAGVYFSDEGEGTGEKCTGLPIKVLTAGSNDGSARSGGRPLLSAEHDAQLICILMHIPARQCISCRSDAKSCRTPSQMYSKAGETGRCQSAFQSIWSNIPEICATHRYCKVSHMAV